MDSAEKQIAGHRRRNADLLKQFEKLNVPLDEKRPVRHQFVAEDQDGAALLAQELYRKNFLVLLLCPGPDAGGRWHVEVARKATPREAASEETTRELAELAERHDAEYDGWGTEIDGP